MFHVWIVRVGVGDNLLVCVRIFLYWIVRVGVSDNLFIYATSSYIELFVSVWMTTFSYVCASSYIGLFVSSWATTFHMCSILLYWIVRINVGDDLFICVASFYIGLFISV